MTMIRRFRRLYRYDLWNRQGQGRPSVTLEHAYEELSRPNPRVLNVPKLQFSSDYHLRINLQNDWDVVYL